MTEGSGRRASVRRALWLSQLANLDRSDRITLVNQMFDMGDSTLESFSDLDDEMLQDTLFGLETWRLVQQVRLATGVLTSESVAHLREAYKRGEVEESAIRSILEPTEEDSESL